MNILWIITTQWRAQACGYAGNRDVITPALDALAHRSINFTQAVTPHPFGPFARAAILTGVESPQNGLRNYFDSFPLGARTVADELNEHRYATAFFGKWHLGKRDPAAPLVGEAHARQIVPPAERGGFTFWEGFESGFQLNNPWLHGTRLPTPVQISGYQSDVLGRRAADWIRAADRGRPWFCVVSLEPPHPPYDQAPDGNRSLPSSLELPDNVPRGGAAESRARRELAGYYAHITATDRAIGELLSRIDEEHTAIFFTSVHGDMHGAHGLFRKGWPYEESVRVPLLIHLPGHGAERRADPVSLIELPEMTAKLAAGEGLSHTPKAWARISMPSVVALPDQCDRTWRGLRTADRKLILNDEGSPWLFFDLKSDPSENHNLVDAREHAAEMQMWIERWKTEERGG